MNRIRCPAVFLALLAGGMTAATAEIGSLRLIGVQTLPHLLEFQGTVVGGLSGLDYDAANDTWIAESDDRSDLNPARFYTLELSYDAAAFTVAEVKAVTFLRQRDGFPYPSKATVAARGGEIPDLESIRFDPRDGSIWYTSEGDRASGMNPFIRRAARDGSFLGELPTPERLRFRPHEERGPRHNLTFEGMAFAPDGETLWVAMEAPLYEDGPPPTPNAGAVTRVTHFDRSGRVLGQFGYPLEPIPNAVAGSRLADNGVSEVLAAEQGQLLMLERAGVQDAAGVFHFRTRLYAADLAGATDVVERQALVDGTFQPLQKRLVLDFAEVGKMPVDNLEGMAWGRRLPNGHATLVFVSDDNFSADQQTQFWAFEVLPAAAPASGLKRNWDDRFEGVVQDEKAIRGFVADYRWLSNFFPCRVEWEGRAYGSSEAAYQSAKYPPAEREVFTTLDADAAKKLSRTKPYDAAAWEARKEASMRAILEAKFAQHPELAARLVATGERVLEETNWWGDKFWGVYQGEGQNRLGRMLMELRTRLAGTAPR